MDITYEPFHPAWKIDLNHELTQACIAAYLENFGSEPAEYDFWDFSTNAVTPVRWESLQSALDPENINWPTCVTKIVK